MPVDIDKEDIATWLPRQLEDQQPGTAMVVMHSVVWQHLTVDVRELITDARHRWSTPRDPSVEERGRGRWSSQ